MERRQPPGHEPELYLVEFVEQPVDVVGREQVEVRRVGLRRPADQERQPPFSR
jgi:hypothetical protein